MHLPRGNQAYGNALELTNQEKSLLSFQVGPFRICVQATEAESILELPEIHSIPLTPPSIAGMFIYRDRVATAVDVARKLGLSGESEIARGQLIIAPLGEDIYGFLVDTVHELIPTEKIHWNSMRGIAKIEAFEHFGVLDDDIILFTSFRDILDMKEIPLDDESLRTFIKSNSSKSDQDSVQPDLQPEPVIDERSISVEESPEAPDTGERSLNTDDNNTVENIDAAKTASNDSADPADLVEDSSVDVPDDAVTREEIRAFKNEEQKDDSVQRKAAPTHRQPAQHKPRTQPKQQESPRRHTQSASRSYQHSQSRPSRRTAVDESSFTDLFTKKTLAITAAIIIILSAAILVLRNGGEETAEGVNMASVGTESPRVQAEPAEFATLTSDREEPEPAAEAVNSTQKSPEPVSEYADRPEHSNEILRVDTDEFTLTVERGNRAEPSPTDNNQNTNNTGRTNNSSADYVTLSGEGEPDYASSAEIDTDQKHPVSEPMAVATEKTSSTAAHSKPNATQQPDVEYVHVVKKGDTLWDISRQYLGNPLHYPELARLSQISDPNWIFPGDVVRIRRK